MAPTKTELWDQLAKALDIIDTTYKYFSGDGATVPNLLADIITLQDVFEGNHIGQTQQQLDSIRSSAGSMVLQGASLLTPVILELAKIGYSSIATSVSAALDDIAAGMDAAGETIKYRNFSFGAIVPDGGNTGDGTVYRVTKDKYNNDIEHAAANAGITRVKITSDKQTGRSSGTEQGLIYGYGQVSEDAVEQGTCPDDSAIIIAKRAHDGKLTNPSFDTYSGSGGSFAVNGWSLSAPANFQADTTNYFRATPGSSTGVSLEFLGNGDIEQILADQGITLDASKPTFLIVRYYRKTVDGSLTIELGSKTEQVADLTTKADTTWHDLTLGIGATDKGWYENWMEDGANVKVTLAGRTTGTLLVDEIILAQPQLFDGKWYLMTAGETDYLKDDFFSFTDTVVNTGRIQYILSRLFSKYLPHTSGVPTYADP